jgi:hypothetical protein
MSKQLKKGDNWRTRDRVYALVDGRGKLMSDQQNGRLYVYATRQQARDSREQSGAIMEDVPSIVRLDDLAGTVEEAQ